MWENPQYCEQAFDTGFVWRRFRRNMIAKVYGTLPRFQPRIFIKYVSVNAIIKQHLLLYSCLGAELIMKNV